jgi:radical SAM protein with 4Fe4S-binding SPASM domain
MKFNWRGESTIHPDYAKIIDHANRIATGSSLIDRIANTNFILPSDPSKKLEILRAMSGLTRVKVSFDSLDWRVYSAQRGDGWSDVYRNITLFYEQFLNPKKTQLVIQAVKTKLNEHEDFNEMLKLWPKATLSIRDCVSGRKDESYSDIADDKRTGKERIPCKQAFARLIVHHSGDVSPCCVDISSKKIIGNVYNESISKIWNSWRATWFRETVANGMAFDSEPCKSCSSLESYAGNKTRWGS